jgi:hypothetical protein
VCKFEKKKKLFNKNAIKHENREPHRFSDDPQVPPSKEFSPKSKNPWTLPLDFPTTVHLPM